MELLNTEEAAEYLGITLKELATLRHRGRIFYRSYGRTLRYKVEDLDKYKTSLKNKKNTTYRTKQTHKTTE